METVTFGELGNAAVGSYQIEMFDDANNEEVQPSVAYNTARRQYMTVWSKDRPGNDDIRAQRFGTDGRLVGGELHVSAGSGADRRYPDVAYGSKPDLYLVVSEHDSGTNVSIWGASSQAQESPTRVSFRSVRGQP